MIDDDIFESESFHHHASSSSIGLQSTTSYFSTNGTTTMLKSLNSFKRFKIGIFYSSITILFVVDHSFSLLIKTHPISFCKNNLNSNVQFHRPVSSSIDMTSTSSSSSSSNWIPLKSSNFQSVTSIDGSCRYAKDDKYLQSVLKLWAKEEEDEEDHNTDDSIVTASHKYYDYTETPLYGHIVKEMKTTIDNDDNSSGTKRPGILLFHTAAGPQDVFLFCKAAQLARLGCVVLICDILSDPNGWAWDSDRTQYSKVREQLVQNDYELMRNRVEVSVQALLTDVSVDKDRLAAMGWCLGAQPILEITRLLQSTRFLFTGVGHLSWCISQRCISHRNVVNF